MTAKEVVPMIGEGLREPGAILLISCYELGHQPIGLASPLGFLERAGFVAGAIDIAAERLDRGKVEQARFIGISVPMHTALRLGVQLMERIRAINPGCHLCVYGLYASLNAAHLFKHGADTVVGGEYEEALVALIERLDRGEGAAYRLGSASAGADVPAAPVIKRLRFATPARQGLKPLDTYVRVEGGGLAGPAGYVEATRGCLHRCRHCPITPVYEGRFFAVPVDIVLEDIRQQVTMGATHITFGDPDFLNGPSHAKRLAEAFHAEFPGLSFDITTKVEHLLEHRAMFPALRRFGCAFIVSAFESLSDAVLTHLDKGHTRKDTWTALRIAKDAGIALRPTWVPFTPWATLGDILEILAFVEDEGLIDGVLPVQYSIRLLVPPGSALLSLPAMKPFLGPLDEAALTYRWAHPDPRMDRLQQAIAAAVAAATKAGEEPDATFHRVKEIAFKAAGKGAPTTAPLPRAKERPPRLTEAWFC